MDTVGIVTKDKEHHPSENISIQEDVGSNELKSQPDYR